MNFQSIKNKKQVFVFLIIFGLILPSFVFLQAESAGFLSALRERGEGLFSSINSEFWQARGERLFSFFERIWQERILPFCQKIWQKLKDVYFRAKDWLILEFEKRRGFFKEGIEREKQEIKEELKMEDKSLWQRFKELIS